MTIGQFVKEGKLKIGQIIIYEDNTRDLIGTATLFHMATTNDCEIGWSWDDSRIIKKVINLVDDLYTYKG